MKDNSRHRGETLGDLGEFRILREIVHPALSDATTVLGLGDDCGFFTIGDSGYDLVVTSDATPQPLVWHLGHTSYRTWGWYSVVINLSDLAAAGATPSLFLSCIDAPASMSRDDFADFFEGVADACKTFKVANAGGNIRSTPYFSACGTAIGLVRSGNQLRRCGCRPDDLLVCIGASGMFSAAFVKARAAGLSGLTEDERRCLIKPTPPVHEMIRFRDAGVIAAASDNSDGVLGALWNIAEASDCAIRLDMADDRIPPSVQGTAQEYRIEAWNLMFCWGDWQVVAAVRSNAVARFFDVASKMGAEYFCLGVATEGEPAIIGSRGGSVRTMNVLRNESFSSFAFSGNAEEHFERMLRTRLFWD